MPDLPDWVLEHKTKGVEIQKRGDNYYAYKITSKWDPEKGRPQKITERYLGKVTKEGIRPPKHKRKRTPEAVLETGNIQLIQHTLSDLEPALKEAFPDTWQTLIAATALKLCYRTPLKNMKTHHDTSWSRRTWPEATLSKNALSRRLREWGQSHGARVSFYRSLARKGEQMALDLTQLFSESQNIDWLEKGYNAQQKFANQLQLLLIYNLSRHAPSFLKLLPGSLKDVTTLVNAIRESGLENVVLVADKGFWSEDNVQELEKAGLGYLIAAKRDLKFLEYGSESDYEDYLSWRGRYVWHRTYRAGDRWVHYFLDKAVRAEEENTFLGRVEKGKEEREDLPKVRNRFGTLALVTNCEMESKEAYRLYKQRAEIESAFDVLRNTLEADKSYMQDRDSIKGYFFVLFLALYAHSQILNQLREKDLVTKYSVRDVLMHLSKVYRVVVEDEVIEPEVPKKTRQLIEELDLPITQNL